MTNLLLLINHYLLEGGLKLPPEHRSDLTPSIAIEAITIYKEFLAGFNKWIEQKGQLPVVPIRPTGSSVYAEKDLEERPETVYGDVDYLVSIPVDYSSSDTTTRRKEESTASSKYIILLKDYLESNPIKNIDAQLTLKGSPLMIIVRLPSGGLVQVDTIMTHSSYVEWMKGRYTPERGIKGYIVGNLYKALGDYLVLTIGTEGVLARIKDGQRVPSSLRSGITYQSISLDFKNFFRDIADYVIEGAYEPHNLLLQYPGLDPENINLDDFARGIVGLAKTMETADNISARKMLQTVYASFINGLDENVKKKVKMDISQEKEMKLMKLNVEQSSRVNRIFKEL